MWVQTHTNIIDFMSPLYPEAFASVHAASPLPGKMLLIELKAEAEDQVTFYQGAPLLIIPDIPLSEYLLDKIVNQPANGHLIKGLLAWWPHLEKKQDTAILP